MPLKSKGQATVHAYEVQDVLDCLLNPSFEWESLVRPLGRDTIIDLWFCHQINQFDIVSVLGYRETDYSSVLINNFNQTQEAVQKLYHRLWIPESYSGLEVLLHRFRSTLWVAYIEPTIFRNG